MSEEEPTLEEQITASILSVEKIAEKLDKSIPEVLQFLYLRELTIINQQLDHIHIHVGQIGEKLNEG